MSIYHDIILRTAPDCDPVLVEEAMRCEYPTLDHLSPQKFAREVRIADEAVAMLSDEERRELRKWSGVWS